MATSTWALNTLNNSDAAFRAWGKGISDALASVGMVKTADTGQIDWATVTLPGTGVYGGYEIWRFNDTLQATAPLFVKIEFGTGTTATRHKIQITIGKGSNGAGALTGIISATPQACQASVGGGPTVRNWYMSSGDGSLVVFMGAPDQASFDFGFAIERSRGPDGAATGAAVLLLVNFGAAFVYNYASASVSPVNYTAAFLPRPIANGGAASGGAAPVFPSLMTDGLGTTWQPRCALTAMALDVPVLSPIAVPGWGTYLPLGVGVWSAGASPGVSGLIRWS